MYVYISLLGLQEVQHTDELSIHLPLRKFCLSDANLANFMLLGSATGMVYNVPNSSCYTLAHELMRTSPTWEVPH